MKNSNRTWYVAKTGGHQGLVVDEQTGRNIAVVYDKTDTPLIAAAPALLAVAQAALDCLVKNVRQTLPEYPESQMMIAPGMSVSQARTEIYNATAANPT